MSKSFKHIFASVFKSDLLKNTSILVSGTTIAQAIPILLQPILRRYYTPEVFGAYAVYQNLLGILVVIASLKYELAIILPKKEKEAANIFFLSFFLNVIFNTILIVCITLFRDEIVLFLNIPPQFAYFIYFVPIGTFLFNLYQSINFWLVRNKDFISISKTKFVRRGVEGSTQVGMQILKIQQGLILGDLLGHFSNVAYAIAKSYKVGLRTYYISFKKIVYVLKKYMEYPKFNLIPAFLSASSYLLPAIFINKFYSSADLGYFDLSKAVLSISLALIATSISNVLLEKITVKYRNKESFIKEVMPIILMVLVMAVIEVIIIRLYGVPLFKWIFGNEWELSGAISRILVFSYAFNFFIASFSSFFISMKKIKLLSIWQVFYFLSIISLIFFKERLFTDFLKIYVLIEIACYTVITILMIGIVVNYEIKIKQQSE